MVCYRLVCFSHTHGHGIRITGPVICLCFVFAPTISNQWLTTKICTTIYIYNTYIYIDIEINYIDIEIKHVQALGIG